MFDEEGGLTPFGVGALFPCVGLGGGVVAGFLQEGLEGAAIGGFVGLVIGLVVGSRASLLTRFARWIAARLLGARNYDGLVRRPDYWGYALVCEHCGWHTRPDDPIRVRDCFAQPPLCCPRCASKLQRPVIECPACGNHCLPRVRFPTSFRVWLWRGDMCGACGCEFDLWGRELRA